MTCVSKSKSTVPPLAYALDNVPISFSRGAFYRWEKLGLIELLRVGSKTLISAQTVEDILAGRIALPRNPGMIKTPVPRSRRKRLVAAE